MKILITGDAGFIGGYLKAFLKFGYSPENKFKKSIIKILKKEL